MRLPVTAILLSCSALACAPARQGAARFHSRGGEGAPTAATGDAEGVDAPLILARAAKVLRERGLRIASCGAGRLVTVPRELDVPCGTSTCLARELFVVTAGERGAAVEILRGVWEPTARYWAMALSPSTAEDAVAREAELLKAILEAKDDSVPIEVSLR